MAEIQKYYMDENGVADLLIELSSYIRNHTSGVIATQEVTDVDTGEISQELVKPYNLTTTKAVVDYVKSTELKWTVLPQEEESNNN